MAASPPKISVDGAITLLKSGQYVPALKHLHYLKRNISILSQVDQKRTDENYLLCLKLLFDRQLVSAEEALHKDNEIQTSLSLLNILDITDNILRESSHLDKTLEKSISKGLTLFETWVLKVLSNIRSSEIKRRHFERRFNEILNLYGYASLLYTQIFIKLPYISQFIRPNQQEFEKLSESIERELLSFFIGELEQAIKDENLIQMLEMRKIAHILATKQEDGNRAQERLLKLEQEIAEKLADFDVFQGEKLEKQHEYFASTQKYRTAYKKFHLLANSTKKRQTKAKFLEATVQLGKSLEDEAKQSEFAVSPDETLQMYFRAKHIYADINAKKELADVEQNMKTFYEKVGDQVRSKIDGLPEANFEDLSKKLLALNECRQFYVKAENSKKIRRVSLEIDKIHKIKYKELLQLINDAQKMGDMELKFLYLEDMHLLCYEMKNDKNAMKYAQEIERLKPQINFNKLEALKKQKYQVQLNTVEEIKSDLNGSNGESADPANSPWQLDSPLSSTMPFSTNRSNTIIDETWFVSRGNEAADGDPDKTKIISHNNLDFFKANQKNQRSLSQIYNVVKKHNQGEVLTNSEIEFLISHGINLPQNVLYYFKFPNNAHEFFVYENPKGGPQILMIPKHLIISRKAILGTVLPAIQPFMESTALSSVFPQDILHSNMTFAEVSKKWGDYLTSFQFSSLDVYVHFLQAINLLNRRQSWVDIVKFFNASLIAEFLNLPSDKMENFLAQFHSFHYMEEFLAISKNPNFMLFALGLKYFFGQNQRISSIFWSGMEIS